MATRSKNTLFVIGFGSQAQAWAQCLRASNWSIEIYLSRPEGKSAVRARELGFECIQPLSELATLPSDALVAFLCPDTEIGPVYREHLAALDHPLTLLLAHGYAVYAKELTPARPSHELALFAPKSIGPKIWSLYQEANGDFHRLVAGFAASSERTPQVVSMGRAMGFARERMVTATFEQEAIGDLLSEQGLLCGGVFTLLEWTLEAMKKAGVPEGLMREECLTELELVAGLLRERGPASTYKAISQAAQAGTVAMQEALNSSNARTHFDAQLAEVLDRRFAKYFSDGAWKPKAQALTERLERWQTELNPRSALTMSSAYDSKPVTVPSLRAQKGVSAITMLTAYDYPTARILDDAGVDMLLVGDSLATVIYGEPNTLSVTMEDMLRHTKAVARGTQRGFVVGDMPFMSYQVSVEQAVTNAGRFLKEAGAQAVKLEGGTEMAAVIAAITRAGIPVCAHIGLTPQTIHAMGTYRMHGKNDAERTYLLESARAVQQAGAFAVVLECVEENLAREITEELSIPTIGIGAGPGCDGQVLVVHDLMGMTAGRVPRFVEPTASLREPMVTATKDYIVRVQTRWALAQPLAATEPQVSPATPPPFTAQPGSTL